MNQHQERNRQLYEDMSDTMRKNFKMEHWTRVDIEQFAKCVDCGGYLTKNNIKWSGFEKPEEWRCFTCQQDDLKKNGESGIGGSN